MRQQAKPLVERLARRRRIAVRQVERKEKQQEKDSVRRARRERLASQWGFLRAYSAAEHAARQRSRAEWEKGPLAPRHSIRPDWLGMSNSFVINDALLDHEKDARAAWCGGRNTLCVREGDRVVVIKGHFSDRIGRITNLNKDRMEVCIEGVTRANFKIPAWWSSVLKNKFVVADDISIPLSWVRLVHPLPDPVTGQLRDTIINELVPTGITKDKVTRSSVWGRLVPTLRMVIPWPPLPETKRDFPTHPGDTLRIDLEKVSFVPTLSRPPMPSAVVDELRNKYSRFRKRHDPEWLAQRRGLEEQEKLHLEKQILAMRTPLETRNILTKLTRKLHGPPQLTDGMLAKIGQVMAAKRRSLQ